jgi:hypothetical protein
MIIKWLFEEHTYVRLANRRFCHMVMGKTIERVEAYNKSTTFYFTDKTALRTIIQLNNELRYLYFDGESWEAVKEDDF